MPLFIHSIGYRANGIGLSSELPSNGKIKKIKKRVRMKLNKQFCLFVVL